MSSDWVIVGKKTRSRVPEEIVQPVKPQPKSKDNAWTKVGRDGKAHIPAAKPSKVRSIPTKQSAEPPAEQPKTKSIRNKQQMPVDQNYEKMMLDILRSIALKESEINGLIFAWGQEATLKFITNLISDLIPSEDYMKHLYMISHGYNNHRTREDELAEPSTFMRVIAVNMQISTEAAIDLVFNKPFSPTDGTNFDDDLIEDYRESSFRSPKDMLMRPTAENVKDWYCTRFNAFIGILREIFVTESFRGWNKMSANRLITGVFEKLESVIKRTALMPVYCLGVVSSALPREKSIIYKLSVVLSARENEKLDMSDTVTPEMVEAWFAYGPIIRSAVAELMDLFGILFNVNPYSASFYDEELY